MNTTCEYCGNEDSVKTVNAKTEKGSIQETRKRVAKRAGATHFCTKCNAAYADGCSWS